jgi:hypothetical protein
MKRIFFLSVGLSTFLCGCALAWLSFDYAKPTVVKAIHPTHNVEIQTERRSLLEGIKATGRGCGNGYGQGYELPDGKTLGEGNICYSSFKEANSEMRIWLKKSDNIIDRVEPSKHKDVRKSERVVASFPAGEFDRVVRIMWVQDQCIHYVSAPDLGYALELEKSEYNPYKLKRARN